MSEVRSESTPRKPISFRGAFLVLPSFELAKREKRIFLLALSPENLVREGRRVLEVWEIRCDDERVFERNSRALAGIRWHYLIRFWKEMYLLGLASPDFDPEKLNDMGKDYDRVREKIDGELLDDPEWIEVWEKIREVSNSPEWWEKVREKFELLKEVGEDELLVKGKKIADLKFREIVEGTYEELEGKDSKYVDEWGLTDRFAFYTLHHAVREELGEEGYEWVREMNEFDIKVKEVWA